MAARYAYYCCARPFLPDKSYDDLEERFREEHPEIELPVGSDQKSSYTAAQQALAIYFILITHGRAESK